MKKQVAGILTTVLVLGLGTVNAFAAGHGRGCYYQDADNDGVCDYAYSACAFVDEDGDGICDNCQGAHGMYYVDADNDGICDNYGSGACPGNGQGRGYGCGRGRGQGRHCR